MDIKWKDPEPASPMARYSRDRQQQREAVFRACRENPGRWAELSTHASRDSARTIIRRLTGKRPRNTQPAAIDGQWEFATRQQAEGGVVIHCRFIKGD